MLLKAWVDKDYITNREERVKNDKLKRIACDLSKAFLGSPKFTLL